MTAELAVEIRPGVDTDLAYVLDCWLRHGWRRGTEPIRAFKDRALGKLADEKVDLRVAHLPGEPESIVGFAVVEAGTVLFVYVTKDARRPTFYLRRVLDPCPVGRHAELVVLALRSLRSGSVFEARWALGFLLAVFLKALPKNAIGKVVKPTLVKDPLLSRVNLK